MQTLVAFLVYWPLRHLSWFILRIVYGLSVTGKENIPQDGGFILASNHASLMDPVVLAASCPRRLTFLAHQVLFARPVLAFLMRLAGTIPVRRADSNFGMRKAVKIVQDGGAVAIFPEGIRQFSGQIGHVKPGVGFLCVHSERPVIPVIIKGTLEALPPRARMLKPSKIQVAFGVQIRYPNAPFVHDAYTKVSQEVTTSWRRLVKTDGSCTKE